MKLVVDEGVDKPIVDKLRESGFDVYYILQTNQGAEDNLVLEIANQQSRILLTQDKDFGELVHRQQQAHFGIVLIKLGSLSSFEKADIINKIFAQYSDELENAFTVLQPNAIRIRK